MKVFLIIFAAIGFCLPAQADPWLLSGQTHITSNTSVTNPIPSDTGANGTVFALPYSVPMEAELCVTSMAVEGYNTWGIVAMFLYTGPTGGSAQSINMRSTASVAAHAGTTQMDTNYCWPEGTMINLMIQNGSGYSGVHGWQITGELLDLPIP